VGSLAVLLRVFERIDGASAQLRGGRPPERLDAPSALVNALAEHPATARLLLRGLFGARPSGPGERSLAGPAPSRSWWGMLGLLTRASVRRVPLRLPGHVLQTGRRRGLPLASGEFGEG
jgi:hypothetical protein